MKGVSRLHTEVLGDPVLHRPSGAELLHGTKCILDLSAGPSLAGEGRCGALSPNQSFTCERSAFAESEHTLLLVPTTRARLPFFNEAGLSSLIPRTGGRGRGATSPKTITHLFYFVVLPRAPN